MRVRRVHGVLGWGACLFAVACGASPPGLTEQRQALASEDEVSELLGFSLRDALGGSAGVTQLTWSESGEGVEFSPNASTTELRWALTVPEVGNKAFRIDQVSVECDPDLVAMKTQRCANRLEAALLFHLETSDGALAGEVPVVSTVYAPDQVSWVNANMNIAAVAGSFAIAMQKGDMDSLYLTLSGRFTPGGSTGNLLGTVVMPPPPSDMMDMMDMMSWPS
ncbi:MAG TPA: hypothetical protein VG963_14820, partial [Polyangiaceae bacterium]|nr:hypothetical protein [Polyangiaceae bacterium]